MTKKLNHPRGKGSLPTPSMSQEKKRNIEVD